MGAVIYSLFLTCSQVSLFGCWTDWQLAVTHMQTLPTAAPGQHERQGMAYWSWRGSGVAAEQALSSPQADQVLAAHQRLTLCGQHERVAHPPTRPLQPLVSFLGHG